MRNRDIAVIGLSCRVPGASNVKQFWDNLANGREAVITFSDEELRREGISEKVLKDRCFVRAGTTLEDANSFDESVFGFTPGEAQTLHPQQRIFLELASEALEHAGYNSQAYKRPIGIYAGMGAIDRESPQCVSSEGLYSAFHNVIGTEKDFLATITAYKLNLRGPAINVQTACSTSLVAVHLACQGLIAGDCALALAGGVSIAVPAEKGYLYEPGGILSPDGHCRAFDAGAGGTVPGSGAGVVLLKLLPEAVADGDVIHAVIRGSAINNDGSLKVGYTAPSADGQRRVIRAAQLAAEVEAESISYIEAHGTATSIGDPIEIAALAQAFRATTQKKGFCAIGSVKTNIGHLDAAAGIIGLIKTILALHHKLIPASLHFQTPNPKLDIDDTPFFVNCHLRPWNGTYPLRAGVSSFGIGGTNAHVILQEAPERAPSNPARSVQLLVLSARTRIALDVATQNLANHLHEHRDANLADVAYTLQVGRREYAHRRVVVCRTREEAIEGLRGTRPTALQDKLVEDEGSAVVFVFPGHGSQHVGMGKELYGQERIFRGIVDECSEKLEPSIGIDLRDVLYPRASQAEWAERRLRDIWIAQPATFVIEYALARLWMHWGIKPEAMIGHSLGEYTAACLAGVMSEDDALRLVAIRSRMMQDQTPGSMLAVELSKNEVQEYLKPGIWLAAENGPTLCELSGTEEDIKEAESQLKSRFVNCHRLRIPRASHSGLMESMLGRFSKMLRTVQLRVPQLRYISNLTGHWITDVEATDPEYWVQHTLRTVQFWMGLETLLNDIPNCAFVEIGPGDSLESIIHQKTIHQKRSTVISSLPKMDTVDDEMISLRKAAGKLWIAGVGLDWSALHVGDKRLRVPLPTYPFEKHHYPTSTYSIKESYTTRTGQMAKVDHVADWFYVPIWKQAPWFPAGTESANAAWMIFIDNKGVGEDLARQVSSGGHTVWLVKPGDQFSVRNDTFTINPSEPRHYAALLSELARQNKSPKQIVHLWSISNRRESAQSFSDEPDTLGFFSVLFLVQNLGAEQVRHPVQLAIITAGAHVITGQEMTSPAAATVLGICRVMSQEYPGVECKHIDISVSDVSSANHTRTGTVLFRELTSKFSHALTAYRAGVRWVQTFEKVQLEEKKILSKGLRERGVYLITGGLGRIGLEVAGYLAQTVKARLVLMGRTKVPTGQEWLKYFNSGKVDSDVYPQIAKLTRLHDIGADVALSVGDVSNPDDVRRVIEETHERFGQINGVFHAAGHIDVTSLKPIARLSAKDCETHFRSKIQGLKVLEAALADEGVDFLLLFSSISAILGGIGYAAYSSANAFMDAFSNLCRQKGSLPCTSVNWDAWDFDKAAAGGSAPGSIRALAMRPEEGVQALHRILHEDELPGQIVVSTSDLNARMDKWLHPRLDDDSERNVSRASLSLDQTNSGCFLDRTRLTSCYVMPRNSLEMAIAGIWEQLLGISNIGVYDEFTEVGGDSLVGMQLCARIRKLLECEFTIINLYDSPTIAGVAELITKNLVDEAGPDRIEELMRQL
jgi:acyl transferase domain-containing protein